MAEGKNPQLSELEQSLINFLCTKKDIDEKVNGGSRRVRSLTLNVDTKNPKHVLFTVQIGMCEAGFSAQTGLKEKGSCFGLERYVRDWYERPSVKTAIEAYIKDQTKGA